MLTVESPVGLRYLETVTVLLQRRRVANPQGEVWEAADLQWWWPRDRHGDPADARVWFDGGNPVAATVFTHWGPDHVGCDVIADADFAPAWEFAAHRSRQLRGARIELAVPDDDPAAQRAARRAGFVPSPDGYAVSWLDPAARREPGRPLPAGFRIVSRSEDRSRPHPMIARNGPQVEDALNQCSLYDPGLDLAVLAPDGEVAGYALFWPDPVTGVGLVEPMRVEDEYAGQGLGRQLLDAGLRGLTARGCSRLKVSMEPANTAAVRLYTGAGFVVSRLDRSWLYAPGQDGDMTLFGDEHVRKYQETDGAEGYHWQNGTTILLLTTKGRKSGKDRTSALIYRDWEDKQLVVASKGGADEPPAWFLNLSENPEVQVQIKGEKFTAKARTATPDEKPAMWEHMVQVWPDYANYQARTDREIPVVVLERVA